MQRFSDFNIKPQSKGFQGDKIKISRVLNREITVHDYKIVESKYKGRCLHIQISIGTNMHVVFTGSVILMDCLERVPKEGFPFLTTIVEENDRFEFQ